MKENWSRPKGAELEENKAALRRMRVIVYVAVALLMAAICLYFGLFVGLKIGG